MEFSHVFYQEILVDEDNIFSANFTEQIKFKKSKVFAVSGLSIDQVGVNNAARIIQKFILPDIMSYKKHDQ